MTLFHRYLGTIIIVLFLVIMLWAVVLRARGRDATPDALFATQHWTENLLGIQVVTGLILLLIGRRANGMPLAWMHYLYGSLFPLIAVIAGRIAGLRRDEKAYVGLGWGAFVALALILRAVQTACGEAVEDLTRCLGI